MFIVMTHLTIPFWGGVLGPLKFWRGKCNFWNLNLTLLYVKNTHTHTHTHTHTPLSLSLSLSIYIYIYIDTHALT